MATLTRSLRVVAAALVTLQCGALHATTPLANQPIFSTTAVPGNLALVLSVEYPTVNSVAHLDTTYNSNKSYLGYFDPAKCYDYVWNANEPERHFAPAGLALARECTGPGLANKWSGNFLNWATMQTIDPFRWALTGGYRSVDVDGLTLIEKAHASGQGGTGNFPNRTVSSSGTLKRATPFDWNNFSMRVQGLGNKLRFTGTGSVDNTPTAFVSRAGTSEDQVYEVSVRVKVCDANPATGPMEANCVAYPNGNYKPTGLIQRYADKIRYSAFGYLNDDNILRDGGVLRARQKFVGPEYQLPGQAAAVANLLKEWDPNTGIIVTNPDTADATATTTEFGVAVANSGVINYLNKFGQITPGSFKTYDPVGELYYATIRYFKNLGNVPEWTSMSGANAATKTTWVDGFPVITAWDDPIQYSCQKNFALGIGDVNTHADKNVAGSASSATEPGKPAAVTADTTVDAVTATNKVGALHGLGASLGSALNYGGCCSNNGALMAGLAYDANTVDLRPDDATKPHTKGRQSLQTYWLDVLEYSTYKANNQFYLAAKYGGFKVPEGFDPYARATDIPQAWWRNGTESIYGQPKPENYFVASDPDAMVSGLTRAFNSIAASLRSFTTSFATSAAQVAVSGTTSYSAEFDAGTWTGELTARNTTFDANTGVTSDVLAWKFGAKLDAQAAATGWDTDRRIVTYRADTGSGVPFRFASLSNAQKTTLDTVYRPGSDGQDYLNYLRGERLHEEASTDPSSANIYRNRTSLLGDIVGSRPRPVGPPSAPFSSAANPGYGTFKTTYAARPTVVYVGTNAGMVHAVEGESTAATAGREIFAYVPSALFAGPTGSPAVTGLAHRGDPDFSHRFLVDAKASSFDIDLGRTVGGTGAGTGWRSLLVGGLGKGGKSYYALDITDPAGMTSEAVVKDHVLWEFSHADLGFTFGEAVAVKTKKYGWVLIFGSGYNNSDGKGYFFIVNPRNGALIEKISTGVGTATNQAGLAHVGAFVLDRTDGTADAVYAGDLLGNLWRLDLRGTPTTYPTPVLLARLLDSSNQPRPVTSRPVLITHPTTNKRWITVGTGRFLHADDTSSPQMQAMYAIMDGDGAAFNATAPAGFTFPIGSSKLRELTNLTQPVTLNLATEIGWYAELGTAIGSGPGWRVITNPTSFYGQVEFTTMLPDNADACRPSGKSRVYVIDLGTGQSMLQAADDSTIAYGENNLGTGTEQFSLSVEGKRRFYDCNTTGGCAQRKIKPLAAPTLRRLNWRELKLAN
jgi:type IV pilus assembly protein PilY1